jgi:doubled CXXCH motif protein/cytochrome c554/c'-like protein
MSRGRNWLAVSAVVLAASVAAVFAIREPYETMFDAKYVGSQTCGSCHTSIYREWKQSPHAKMTRKPSAESVVGDFSGTEWTIPAVWRRSAEDARPVARMDTRGGDWFMSLREPGSDSFRSFKIDYVIGYQYRQSYLTREPGGVLRKLPLEWSVARREFFPYWNEQEASAVTQADLWAQMTTLNSAWNLFCARCHTTALRIEEKDAHHRRARTHWLEDGIACESCHGPGSLHARYFGTNYLNRLAAFVENRVEGQPVAYIVNGAKLPKGPALSVCARCHGPDIERFVTTETYRIYEPGYSKEGRVNDLSDHFKEMPLSPGRKVATVETWEDGRPKGIAMVFRSFVESKCYERAEVRCHDCHDPHRNDRPRRPGLLEASAASNAYCLRCHAEIAAAESEHTRHEAGRPGSFCYDCHMPKHIETVGGGVRERVRTHDISDIPRPENTVRFGPAGAPNACTDCHRDKPPQWAVERLSTWRNGKLLTSSRVPG